MFLRKLRLTATGPIRGTRRVVQTTRTRLVSTWKWRRTFRHRRRPRGRASWKTRPTPTWGPPPRRVSSPPSFSRPRFRADRNPTRVELTWQDNAPEALCYKVQKRLADGTWTSLTGGTGSADFAMDAQPSPGQCYRALVANEHGRSAYSNEACLTGLAITATPLRVVPATPVTPAAPGAPPVLGAGPGGDSAGLPWWALAAVGVGTCGRGGPRPGGRGPPQAPALALTPFPRRAYAGAETPLSAEPVEGWAGLSARRSTRSG